MKKTISLVEAKQLYITFLSNNALTAMRIPAAQLFSSSTIILQTKWC